MDGSAMPETRSTCPYCGVGCGVLLRPDGQGGLAVRGDPQHPANHGRLCSKGSALGQTVGLSERLLSPMIQGRPADWETSLTLVAQRFQSAIAEHGPDSVAFYVSGQLLTEDYYIANKLMKGCIGSANIDTNSRLCMASTVAGHKRAFGADTVPGTYEDLEQADLVVLVGSNLAWCHPVLHQRLLAAKAKRGTRIVVVDPRRTATCADADLHLPIASGGDVALFNRLLAEIAERGAMDADFLTHVTGFEDAVQNARRDDGTASGLTEAQIAEFCDLWIGTKKVVTVFSQGVNQSTSGADKVNAILNCHLATGRIGTPGCGPLSVTGQPNAMGGREVGGLANMLACHLDLENPDHRAAVRDFWQVPSVPDAPGLKAVDMFRAVGDGRIKALWIIHTNPAVSMPDAAAVRAAIASCPFVVVSDITAQTDTARLADVLLPAAAWAEKDGTVTNSDRTISRQRAVLPVPGAAKPDWEIMAEVGRRMGFDPVSAKPPAAAPSDAAPFRLNTGRLRDQWHTMTRTALSPRLSGHLPEPFVDMHPDDARALGVSAADLVVLSNDLGRAILRARITADVQPGHLFAPIHWTGETAPCARIDDLVAPHVDPVSGQPESKAATVAASVFQAEWYGFAVSSKPMHMQSDYWAKAVTPQGFRAELAGASPVADWEAEARAIFGAKDAEVASIVDAARGTARIALHEAGMLIGALYVARDPVAVMRDYLVTLPGQNAPGALTGRVPASVPNPGPVLCSCFGTGINTIVSAIETRGLMSVAQIGDALGAGTNCGSCRPELAQLLAQVRTKEAAE